MASTVTQLNNSPNEKNSTMKKPFMAMIFFLILIDLIFLALMGFWAVDASAQMGGWLSPGMNTRMMRGRENPGMMSGPQGMRGEESPPEQIPDDEHHLWGNLRELALDEKQKQEVKEISNRVMKEMIKKRTDEQITGIEMKELLDKDPVDLKAVENKLKQMEAIKSKMQLTLIKAGEEVKSILTPNQRKKFKAMLKMGPMVREQPHGRFDG